MCGKAGCFQKGADAMLIAVEHVKSACLQSYALPLCMHAQDRVWNCTRSSARLHLRQDLLIPMFFLQGLACEFAFDQILLL